MACPTTPTSPVSVVETIVFPQNSSTLTSAQTTTIQGVAASWHAAGASAAVRVDGYASAEGQCAYNWNLSCRRAEAVRAVLERASPRGPGVSSGLLTHFAHGESASAGPALATNRRATISIPHAPVPPPPPPAPGPTCLLPMRVGHGRGCGSGTDFTHFDFPSISATSAAKLAAWAAARPVSRGPFRSLVTDTECELEMDAVLSGLAGTEGHAAFTRFVAGTGGTATHGPTSTLGALALASAEFALTLARVKLMIETQLAAQAGSGRLDPCLWAVTPPPTFFAARHFLSPGPLKTIIGGTQGEELFVTGFTGNLALRSYTIDLRFRICDDFGVDEADLYFWGLMGFWVLQHERSASAYAPFINELDLPVTLTGTF